MTDTETELRAETPVAETPVDEGKPETEQPKETVETKADPEPTPDESQEDESKGDETDDDSEDKPRKRSGYARMKQRALLAEAEIERLRTGAGEQPKQEAKSDGPKAPKEEDYNGDWGAYVAARAAFEAAQAVEARLTAREERDRQERFSKARGDAISEFEQDVEAFKAKAKDFDAVVTEYVQKNGALKPYVADLVMQSDKGPELTYFLAKNPAIGIKVNSLPPLSAAKEIGRLESQLSQSPKKATQAPKPITSPKGGADASRDYAKLAQSDDISDYVKARNEEEKRGR